ncbi:glycosyltransferase family 2 protein [Flavobacterium sharifuzzamanii]|uniref:glycosyltransferase family 2 protein n=1 Tax=Flavobacterium sharifuzzamanii TaxID=2211133 RepID=UPI000DABA2F0|nr:glycosyltransferase [Flavobacterium sharifuzzamanii]KAF2081175.1 glycosyltransferase family 2 protein [Flavobacterium sharifuzzamanii]
MLAIVIPYYKLRFFESTLQSLVMQTDKRFKVYIGDDASPENPAEILKEYEDKLNFVYHRFETNLGSVSLTQQWERCIQLMHDEKWLMILGDDDQLGENVVELFNNAQYGFRDETINVIRFASQVIDERGNRNSILYNHPEYELATDSFLRKWRNDTRSSLSEYIFRKASFQKYGFVNFPLAWYSDDMAWIEFASKGSILSINQGIVFFRYSEYNISGKTDNLDLKEISKLLFYERIARYRLNYFAKSQRVLLLTTFEAVLKKRQMFTFGYFLFFCKKYLANGEFISLRKFFKRQIIYVVKGQKT